MQCAFVFFLLPRFFDVSLLVKIMVDLNDRGRKNVNVANEYSFQPNIFNSYCCPLRAFCVYRIILINASIFEYNWNIFHGRARVLYCYSSKEFQDRLLLWLQRRRQDIKSKNRHSKWNHQHYSIMQSLNKCWMRSRLLFSSSASSSSATFNEVYFNINI